MKNLLFALACLTLSVPAFADEYQCHSIQNEVEAYLVFDDGPGGLDHADVKVFNQQYTLVVWDNTPATILEISDRDTFKNTFEYGGDKVEIGFTGKDGVKVDMFVKRIQGQVFDGTVYVQKSGAQRKAFAYTCSEL